MFIRKYFAPEGDLAGGGGGEVAADTSAPADVSAPNDAPVEMEDTIRSALKTINERKIDARGRAHGEGGRFISTEEEQSTGGDDVPVEPAVAEQPTEIPPVEVNTNPDNLEFTDNAGQKHAVNINEPPMSWRAEAKAEYSKLPEWAKREAHKREHDFHNGVQQYKAAATFATQIGAEFKPYEALLRSQQWTPQALTRDMMNTHYRLSTGDNASKAAEVVRIAGLYNLTVQDLQSALTNPNSVNTTSVPQTPAEVLELRQRLDRIEQERAQAENVSIQEQIRGFETDGKHPHFKQVASTMGALMSNGQASTMQEAYDKAVWAVPEIRAKLQAEQQAAERKIAADKAAAAKKAASVNVPARGKHPSAAPVGSMEDTIRATYRRLNGGA